MNPSTEFNFKAYNRNGIETILIVFSIMFFTIALWYLIMSLEFIQSLKSPLKIYALLLLGVWTIYLSYNVKSVRILIFPDDTIQIYRSGKLAVNEPIANLVRIIDHGAACKTFIFKNRKMTFTNLMLTGKAREKQYSTYHELVRFFCKKYHFRGTEKVYRHLTKIVDYENPGKNG